MNNENIVFEKSKKFSYRIIRLYTYLKETKKENVLSKQVLRSGTSIGANLSEGFYAQSGADFFTKYSIALKEASETAYWLDILHDTEFINDTQYESIYPDCIELVKLLTAITKTIKNNSKNNQ